MLRIHQLCFARLDPEEVRVEHVHVGQDGTSADIGGKLGELACARNFQLIDLEVRDGFHAAKLVAPELGHALCSGESAGHADDRDSFQQGRGFNAAHDSPPERRPRNRVKAPRCRCALSCTSDRGAVTDSAYPRCWASLRMVANSNKSVRAICVCRSFCKLECTATRSRESPPRSKKLSSSPMFGTFRMCCQSWASALSSWLSGSPAAWDLSLAAISRVSRAVRSHFSASESGTDASL